MKVLMVLAAIISAKSDRKFTNKEDFMNSKTPSWWKDFSADKRMNWIKNAPIKFFNMHFPRISSGNVRLRALFLDIAGDMDRIRGRCRNNNNIRTRRRTDEFKPPIENETNFDMGLDDDSDPMGEKINILGRKLRGDIASDIHNFVSHQGRFIMEEIYRKGRNCEFVGVRLVSFFQTLNFELTIFLVD